MKYIYFCDAIIKPENLEYAYLYEDDNGKFFIHYGFVEFAEIQQLAHSLCCEEKGKQIIKALTNTLQEIEASKR